MPRYLRRYSASSGFRGAFRVRFLRVGLLMIKVVGLVRLVGGDFLPGELIVVVFAAPLLP